MCTFSDPKPDTDTCELNTKCRKPSSVGLHAMYIQFNIANKLKWVKTLPLPCFDRLVSFFFVAFLLFVVD